MIFRQSFEIKVLTSCHLLKALKEGCVLGFSFQLVVAHIPVDTEFILYEYLFANSPSPMGCSHVEDISDLICT